MWLSTQITFYHAISRSFDQGKGYILSCLSHFVTEVNFAGPLRELIESKLNFFSEFIPYHGLVLREANFFSSWINFVMHHVRVTQRWLCPSWISEYEFYPIHRCPLIDFSHSINSRSDYHKHSFNFLYVGLHTVHWEHWGGLNGGAEPFLAFISCYGQTCSIDISHVCIITG